MSWRNLRSISSDPLSNFLSKLSQDQILREAQDQSEVGENLEEDRFKGIFSHSILEIRALPAPFANKIPKTRVFLTPLEPDRNRLRFWCKFDSGADTQHDYSLFGSEILNKGYSLPVPITSPTFDEGIVGGQIALQYNNTDVMPKSAKVQFGSEVAYTRVTDNPNIRLSSYLDGTITGYDGFSISIFNRPMQVYLDTEVGGSEFWQRRLYMKIDNDTGSYGYEGRITPAGTLLVVFRRNGVNHEFMVTNCFPIAPGADFNIEDYSPTDFRSIGNIFNSPTSNTDNYFTRLDIVFVFSNNSCIVRKDGVDQTVQSTSGNANFPSNPATHTKDLIINGGPFASNTSGGVRPIGVGITEWSDFRIYAGQLTSTESTRLHNNKYSISNINFGCVALHDYFPQSTAVVHLPDETKDPLGITKLFPTASGGSEWSSWTWGNGISRTIQQPPPSCTPDPYDNQVYLNRAGDPKFIINGDGTARLDTTTGTGSPRVTVLADRWQNVEATVYLRCPTVAISGLDVTMRAKTDHYCVSETDEDILFGGYNFTFDFTNQRVLLRRELSHDIGYSDRMFIVNQSLPANTWIGFKGVLYNRNDGNVKLEMYRDNTNGLNGGTWTKITEGVDDGTWPGSGGGPPPYKPPTQGSAIRCDIGASGGYLDIKNWSIREITHPLMDLEEDEEG